LNRGGNLFFLPIDGDFKFLSDVANKMRRINAWKIAIDMLVDNFDKRE